MNAILICPAERPAVPALSDACPLVNLPIFGKSLLTHWLEHLATSQIKKVKILAADRPEELRAAVGNGARWGLVIEVIPETRELNFEEARQKYGPDSRMQFLNDAGKIFRADHLPSLSEKNLFDSYSEFFLTVESWFSCAAAHGRVGLRQIKPGVWVGMRSRISSSASLRAPCWLGENVRIGKNAIVGPNAIIEDNVVVDAGAEISETYIASETLIGALTRLHESLAIGNTLINWRNASTTKIPDPFLMCALRQNSRNNFRARAARRVGQFSALAALALSSPFTAGFIFRSLLREQKILRSAQAVQPPDQKGKPGRLITYYELASARGWWRRWPQLWNIVRGEFSWVGNRPLSPFQSSKLATDFERCWLAAPIGLFSQADAENCAENFSDEARAHASFYAAQANWRFDLRILRRIFLNALRRLVQPAPGEPSTAKTAELNPKPISLSQTALR